MNWFHRLMEWLFARLFNYVNLKMAVTSANLKLLEQDMGLLRQEAARFIENQGQDNADFHQHLKDLEKRYQRLTVDATPPNVVTTDSLVLLELNNRLLALEKVVKP